MSSRQLLLPTKPESKRDPHPVFRLQPPPHRYKENRRFQVLTKRESDCPDEAKEVNAPFQKQKRSSMSDPFLADQDEEKSREEARLEEDTGKSQDSCYSRDDSYVYSKSGGILTSPVKSDVRNSAFFGDSCVWNPQASEVGSSSPEKNLSASRTSSHSPARCTFGTAARRRVSLKSPLTGEGEMDQDARHTIVHLSPMTPLSPRTMSSLHTPRNLQFDDGSQLGLPLCKNDYEPLSATLKRIGASRNSIERKQQQEDAIESIYAQESLSDWELNLKERLEDQKKMEEARRVNQEALQQAKGSFPFTQADDAGHHPDYSVKKQTSSPWLDKIPRDKPSTSESNHSTAIQSIRSTVESFSNMFRRIRKEEHEHIRLAVSGLPETKLLSLNSVASRSKGDGWGGIRPRSSWFADFPLGPLASPATTTASKSLLRPFQLQPILTKSTPKGDDVWVDEDEPLIVCTTEEQELNLNKVDDSIQKLRVRFPSFLSKPNRNKRPVSSQSGSSLDSEGVIVKYTDTSAEGRPLSTTTKTRHLIDFFRSNGGLLLAFIMIIGVSAFVALIGTKAAQAK